MTPVLHGRGGWPTSGGRSIGKIVIAMLAGVSLALASGCSSQKPKPGAGAGAGAGAGGAGMGEQALGGSGKSSLEQFQKGTLGGEGGPLSDIHFDYNDYTIRAQDSEVLRSNASWLSSHANARVQVEGHCDERGSEEYNIALGAKRAQAAKDYLQTLGVESERMSTISYGKELPICTDHTEDCWEQNRRDHFVVSQ
jgi:peptidoglycan-associated lipoprotein